jgi:protein tyrosine phosphatase
MLCVAMCLAPKMETVDDFWLMIWHENVHVVVALVLLVEGNKVSVFQLTTVGEFEALLEKQIKILSLAYVN